MNNLTFYYMVKGTHTHVRVFTNGAFCGRLCFRNDEFDELKANPNVIQFKVDENPPKL